MLCIVYLLYYVNKFKKKKNNNVASTGESVLASHMVKIIRKLDQCPLQRGGFIIKSTPDEFLTRTLMDIGTITDL